MVRLLKISFFFDLKKRVSVRGVKKYCGSFSLIKKTISKSIFDFDFRIEEKTVLHIRFAKIFVPHFKKVIDSSFFK